MPELRVSVSGDPDGGWIVDVHDGDRHGVYHPRGVDLIQAMMAGLREHDGGLGSYTALTPSSVPPGAAGIVRASINQAAVQNQSQDQAQRAMQAAAQQAMAQKAAALRAAEVKAKAEAAKAKAEAEADKPSDKAEG